ncbi:MAG: hypothetical protein H0S80_10860 [Desulfovibrionaceae bacterium]|nr:hypothetical protein [Desulfovibrionaceae bacterium]
MASTADNTVSIVSSVGLNPRCAEALPIHDGFIVQKRYEALLVQAMTDAFEEMFHVVPKIKWSDSPLRVFFRAGDRPHVVGEFWKGHFREWSVRKGARCNRREDAEVLQKSDDFGRFVFLGEGREVTRLSCLLFRVKANGATTSQKKSKRLRGSRVCE